MIRLLPKPTPILAALALTLAPTLAAPALAQNAGNPAAEARIRKLEAEVAALQRKVFPGGDGTFFPQLQPGQTAASPTGTPAATPLTDVLARMEALEAQVARLTAQSEESANKLGKVEGRLAALESASAASAAAAAAAATPAATSAPASAVMNPAPKPAAVTTTSKPVVTPPAGTAKAGGAATKAAAPSAARLAAVSAIAKPQTADPGDDEYSYGFRLWEAKFYPESQQQLKLFLQKYPKHARGSFARNLLGRTYLEEGNLDEAAKWFYENYKADKVGARAPDSVLFLAETWLRKKDNNRACIALAQLVDDYPAEAAGRLRSQYEGVRAKVKCN
jgi:TolA-binding protein